MDLCAKRLVDVTLGADSLVKIPIILLNTLFVALFLHRYRLFSVSIFYFLFLTTENKFQRCLILQIIRNIILFLCFTKIKKDKNILKNF